MPRKAILKNGELYSLVAAHLVITFIITMLEEGSYDPKVDKLKVVNEEEWEREKSRRVCR